MGGEDGEAGFGGTATACAPPAGMANGWGA